MFCFAFIVVIVDIIGRWGRTTTGIVTSVFANGDGWIGGRRTVTSRRMFRTVNPFVTWSVSETDPTFEFETVYFGVTLLPTTYTGVLEGCGCFLSD